VVSAIVARGRVLTSVEDPPMEEIVTDHSGADEAVANRARFRPVAGSISRLQARPRAALWPSARCC
jgi:hypothetical protein